jgi:hypothetical protein
MLARGALHDSEIVQRIEEATKEFDAMFLILGHPTMWPDMIQGSSTKEFFLVLFPN